MNSAFHKALELICAGDAVLLNILLTTAKMSLASSLIALALGVPLGILYGAYRFPGRKTLVIVNRTLSGLPPVVCGLLFYLLFSGVGPFGKFKLLFTVKLMIIAQVALITPIVIGNIETYVSVLATPVKETAKGMGLGGFKIFVLILNESLYGIISAYLTAFARAIAEVGCISMVGGAIAWKTNVMTTAIMQYTNMGNFSMGIALGLILMTISLAVNAAVSLVQGRFDA